MSDPVAWLRRRTPLRVWLVVVLLALVALALVGSGVAAVATLRTYLLAQVDSQLGSASPLVATSMTDTLRPPDGGGAGTGGSGGGGPVRPGPGGPGGAPLPNAYVVAVTATDGTTVYGPVGVLTGTGASEPALPHPSGDATAALGRHWFTVPGTSGGPSWRVLAQPATLLDGTSGTLFIAQSLGAQQATTDRLVTLLSIIGGITLLVVGAAGYVIVRVSLRPLRHVEDTAARIAAGDLSSRVPELADPRTEVGGLSLALNTMLGQVETAFAQRTASEAAARDSEQRLRRFAADASHELRTPLTTVRGFAELYRQGALTQPDALDAAMGRIEAEAGRMGRLVEDLLLLARLDQQQPAVHGPVDLLALAQDAVGDAHVADPSRPVSLTVGALDVPPIVSGDEAQLRQVLANLVGNALVHTPADTAVTVSVGTDVAGRRARLTVADEGPGMSAASAVRVFERFYREDVARGRDAGGAGLGLSIVSAIVAAHGGTVRVDTAPGAGAKFVVELPLKS